MAKRKTHNQVERRRSGRLASAEVVVNYRRRTRKRTKINYAENVLEDSRAGNGDPHDDEWRQDRNESAEPDNLEDVSTEADYGVNQTSNRQRVRFEGKMKNATVGNAPSHGRSSTPLSTDKEYDPEAIAAARTFEKRKHEYLKPLYVSPDRLTIDSFNVVLYAEDGAKDVWAGALSSSRFNGPRKSPPWRELHRLSNPAKNDLSDWAETIQWAKEQNRLHGSVWIEDPHSLETIRAHRIKRYWASEELITGDKFSGDASQARGG
jgi:hypothetical protein